MKRLIFFLGLLAITPYLLTKEKSSIRRKSPHVITLFMGTIPEPIKSEPSLENLYTPGKIARKIFKQKLNNDNPSHFSPYVTYAGFVDLFNANGQVIFPRKGTKDTIDLIITRKVHPIILRGNTVEYFVRDKDEPIDYYQLTRTFDKEKNYHYWTTKKIQTPKSKKIPPSATVIFAKPKHITIPQGKNIAMGGKNLLLPPFFPTKKVLANNLNGIHFLKANKYFKRIKFKTKLGKDRIGQIIIQ